MLHFIRAKLDRNTKQYKATHTYTHTHINRTNYAPSLLGDSGREPLYNFDDTECMYFILYIDNFILYILDKTYNI